MAPAAAETDGAPKRAPATSVAVLGPHGSSAGAQRHRQSGASPAKWVVETMRVMEAVEGPQKKGGKGGRILDGKTLKATPDRVMIGDITKRAALSRRKPRTRLQPLG